MPVMDRMLYIVDQDALSSAAGRLPDSEGVVTGPSA
jgi:hypothetical protein